MRIDVVTIFPDYLAPLELSLIGKARRDGLLDVRVHDTWTSFLEAVRPGRLFLMSTRGTRSLYSCVFAPGDALVFGSESRGLPEDFYVQHAERLFRIPMPGEHARSINLANAASIAAYEAYRQLEASRLTI